MFVIPRSDQVLVDTSEMRDKEKMGERRLAQDARQWRTTSVRIITTPVRYFMPC